jgi:hypothetical protein
MRDKNGNEIMNDNTVIMIKELRKYGKLKLQELEKLTGIKERQIRRHKEIAIKFGYNIMSTGGKNGGYELIEEKLTNDEWIRLKNNLNIELYEKVKRIIEKV